MKLLNKNIHMDGNIQSSNYEQEKNEFAENKPHGEIPMQIKEELIIEESDEEDNGLTTKKLGRSTNVFAGIKSEEGEEDYLHVKQEQWAKEEEEEEEDGASSAGGQGGTTRHTPCKLLRDLKHELPPRQYQQLVKVKFSNNAESSHLLLGQQKGTQTSKKSFTCDVCRISFAQKCSLLDHIRIHTGEMPFTCDVCDKSFIQKSNLVAHMKTHTGEKPFTCDVCRKSFNSKPNLLRHKRTHTGETPFTCDVCSKSFTNKANLERHQKTHTGEKPFNCDVCSKSFTRRIQLVDHMRRHTGERPFTCDLCSKSFTRKQNLVAHKTRHTGNKTGVTQETSHFLEVRHMRIHKERSSLKKIGLGRH